MQIIHLLLLLFFPQTLRAVPPQPIKPCAKKGDYLFNLGGARQCLDREGHAVLCKLRGYSQQQCYSMFDAQIAGKMIKPPIPVNKPVDRRALIKRARAAGGTIRTDELGVIDAQDETCRLHEQYIPQPKTPKGYSCIPYAFFYKKMGTGYVPVKRCAHGWEKRELSKQPKIELNICLEKSTPSADKAPKVVLPEKAPAPKPGKTPPPHQKTSEPIGWQKYLKQTGKTLTGSKNSPQTHH